MGAPRNYSEELRDRALRMAMDADAERVYGLRVLALVDPVTRSVILDDDLAAKASTLEATLAPRSSATDRGRQYLRNARALLALTQSLTSQATGSVLALSPADAAYGATPVAVSEARGTLAAAEHDFVTAERDATAAARATRGAATDGPTTESQTAAA